MKLFVRDTCDFCKQVNTENVKMEIIFVDNDEYQGVQPPGVPLLQFDNHVQFQGVETINAIFDELRKRI